MTADVGVQLPCNLPVAGMHPFRLRMRLPKRAKRMA